MRKIVCVVCLTIGFFLASYGQATKNWQILVFAHAEIGNTFQALPDNPFKFTGDISNLSIFDLMDTEISPGFLMGLGVEARFRDRWGLSVGTDLNIMRFRGNLNSGTRIYLPYNQTWDQFTFPILLYHQFYLTQRGDALRIGFGSDWGVLTSSFSTSGSAGGTSDYTEQLRIIHQRKSTISQGWKIYIGWNMPLGKRSELMFSLQSYIGTGNRIPTTISFFQNEEPFPPLSLPPEEYLVYSYSTEILPIQVFGGIRYAVRLAK